MDMPAPDVFDWVILGCYAAIALLGLVQMFTGRVMGRNMDRFTPGSVKAYAFLSGVFYFLGGAGALCCGLFLSSGAYLSYLVLGGGFALTLAAYFLVLKRK